MGNKDYYKVLGISKSASQDDVKAAFKKLARKYHPDVAKDKAQAEDKFKEISEAYEVLGDVKKRKQYDQYGSFNFSGGGPQNPFNQGYWQQSNFNDVDLEDIFGDIFGFGGPKRGRKTSRSSSFNFGGAQGSGQTRSRKGSDINWALPIEFLEAVNGCEKQILLTDGKKVKVKIPAGVMDGSKVRLTGKGNPGVAGGQAGDLIIETQVKDHPYFRREGNDIHMDLKVSLDEALTGAKVAVPTIHGPLQMKIPKGTQSGQKLRLKGKGAPHLKTKELGNQYIYLLVTYPKDLSAQEIEQIQKILEKHKTEEREF